MAYIGRTTDGFGVRQRFLFTPDAGATSVSGNDASGATLTFSDSVYMDVFLNGVLLKAGTDYNTNTANTIAGLTATVANDEVTVLVYDIFTTADMVSATSGGTFVGNVAMSGTLGVTGATTTAAITASGVVDITNTTDASDDSGDTGALRVEGGASIAKKLYVGTDLDVDGTANLDVVDIDGAVDIASTTTLNDDVTFTGANYNVTWDKSANLLQFVDNAVLRIGTGNDLDIYHSSNVNTFKTQTDLPIKFIDAGAADMATFTPNGAVSLYHNGTAAITTASGGAVTVANGLTLSDGNLVLASGHGIDFSATGDGSATDTSELLDDYEEGTWVPTITGGSNPSFSTSVAAGKYIKVGNLVFVQWNMIITGVSSQGSGNAQVGGLPYASNCNTYQGHIGIMYNDVWDTEIQKGYVPNGQSHIQLAPDGRTQSNFGFASTLGTGYFGGGGSYITG
jgi:hypothetical protein